MFENPEVDYRDPAQLDRLLAPESLSAVFQPIVELRAHSCEVHAVEGLIRGPEGTGLEAPEALFTYLRDLGAELQGDRAAIARIIEQAAELPRGPALSINVHATTLSRDVAFSSFLLQLSERASIPLTDIILEVVEYAAGTADPFFCASLELLRAIGVRIAIDDIGPGQYSYRKILDCLPHYIKIDRYFIRSCHDDAHRQAVLESIVVLADHVQARVVAVGVETLVELEALTDLGIDLVQGYLFSRPRRAQKIVEHGYLLSGELPAPEAEAALRVPRRQRMSR